VDEEDLQPQHKPAKPKDLTLLSIAELENYILGLETEIARAREEIAAAGGDAGTRLIVLDAAVMLEAGWNNVCDRLVYVHVPREARLKRLAAGRGWDPKEVEEREGAQRSLTEKATRAGDAVDNSGSPAEVQRQVDDLLAQWGLAP